MMIATGTWKAKKHREAAHLAREAWARLKKARGDVWILHTPPKSLGRPEGLAASGKAGVRTYERVP